MICCLYLKLTQELELYLSLYIDDIILTANDATELNSIKNTLSLEFNRTDIGKLKASLGVKIDIRSGGIFLSQRVCIQNLLKRFGTYGKWQSDTNTF